MYGKSVDALVGVAILAILMSLSLLLSIVPLIGFAAWALLTKFCIIPWVFSFSGLYETWLISLMFWLGVVGGAIISVLLGIVALAAIRD